VRTNPSPLTHRRHHRLQASQDAQEGLNKTLDSLGSLGSMDGDSNIYRDPTDPTKVGAL